MEEKILTMLLKMTLSNPNLRTRAVVNVLKDVLPIMFHPHVKKVEVTPTSQQAEI